MEQLELRVSNLDCEHDAAAIERGLATFDGLNSLKIYPSAAKVNLVYDPAVTDPAHLKEKLNELGFPPQTGLAMPKQPKPWRNPKVLTSAGSGLLLVVGIILGQAGAPAAVTISVYGLAMIVGGYYFGREALETLIFQRQIGIELLMAIAAVTAALLGQAVEGALLVFLYSISEAIEGYTEEKTRSAVKALMDLTPKTALVRRDGQEITIPAEEVRAGDLFIVKPGQAIASDGRIVNGVSSVNQAPVTGESLPVEKGPGDELFAGSLNGQGALEVRATTDFADNTISRIIHMVEEAQERKGQRQRFVERFGRIYSPAILSAGVLIGLIPPLLFGAEWTEWIGRATVFIVAAAPCALVISIPITMVATLGTGARQGVLIKGGITVEELARVRVVALDKTGTITQGLPVVTDVVVPGDGVYDGVYNKEMVLTLAAGIERRSEHPLAQAIVNYATDQGLDPVTLEGFQALSGAGAQAQWQGKTIVAGRPGYFSEELGQDLSGLVGEIDRLRGEGKTVIAIGAAGEQHIWGLIALRDKIRGNAAAAIAGLSQQRIGQTVMLTGDNQRTAQAIAQEAGLDLYFADLKPEDKVSKVRQLTKQYGHIAMVGDGVNDAPALAEATVGVAMGAAGTDVALETADVALMADDLEKLVYALALSQRSQRIVRQNLVLSAIVISALALGAVLGMLGLPAAVLGHELSEFLVIGNGLRMLRA
ncbi:MAG: cation-translocating P-type ATPase [Chloroflexota bacterium]|jgi:Cd2+/Zn2+-exporting ATPase